MAVLSWDKPKKKLAPKDWKKSYGFEDGPDGGYVPNMSAEDNAKWKAKITGTKLGFPQVEIRKQAGQMSQMLIIVNLGKGYNYKTYRAEDAGPYMCGQPTKGINVHISLNGPAQLTFAEMAEMHLAVEEAKVALENL